MRLQGKVALVTGGGSGIGRSTAVLFAAEGARVVVSDLHEANANETVDQIQGGKGEATSVAGDVSDSEDARRMVRTAVDTYGRLDVLVNSAGITPRGFSPDASPEAVWDRVIDVNLKGTYLVSYHAVPEMKRLGGGSIVHLASIIGLVAHYPGMSGKEGGFNPYAPSKGGVVQLTRNMAVQFAGDNIRVNCICPGYTRTALTEEIMGDSDVVAFLEERHPLGRLGLPEDMAYAALFLASDEASFVTGITLPVDGGYTAQ